MKTKLRIFVCVICVMLCLPIALSSCNVPAPVQIESAEINENGELILVFSNGKEQNLGVVVGKDGKDGKDGVDGIDGDDASGDSVTIVTNGDSVAAASAKGLRSAVSITCGFQTTVRYPGGTQTREYSSAGSGVIYHLDKSTGDAFIITNYHVVYDTESDTENGISEDIKVYLYGAEIRDKAIEATYVGGSLYYDIAVLRVENSEILKDADACEVSIADSDKTTVGGTAIAIGNARGLGISATAGVISVDSEYITMTAADETTEVSFRVMRVDAAVNSGNSGGGLYDAEGNLIGIVNAKIVYGGVENIGYAIPSNVAVSVTDNIIDHCFGTDAQCVRRAMLGVTVSITDSKAVFDSATGGLAIEEVVSVYAVNADSLAEGVLQEGDILLRASVNGGTEKRITRQYHIIDLMLDVRAGDTVTMTVLRGGVETAVSVTVTEDSLIEY